MYIRIHVYVYIYIYIYIHTHAYVYICIRTILGRMDMWITQKGDLRNSNRFTFEQYQRAQTSLCTYLEYTPFVFQTKYDWDVVG